ncbi:hypothetical protein BGZ65_010858 [Modicella reniformis]|uniref:Elongation factor P n=1 Tax=Modicella reniformis TaxID=1440133 RepID=A0A9P6SRL3_9FUNG|nr:hypothetical protein BGZ65_010858 [Modicella reniformis]
MGRGTSTVKLDIQDLITGTKHTERFRSGDMVEVTELDEHRCQFLYRSDGHLHLMNPETFEMYEVPESVLEGMLRLLIRSFGGAMEQICSRVKPAKSMLYPDKQIQLLMPDMSVHLSMFQPDPEVLGKPIAVKLPAQAVYQVKETQVSAAQASKGTLFKNADLENGIKVQVPEFINIGDKVVVDTETGKYVKRA